MVYFNKNNHKNGLKLDKAVTRKAFICSSALFAALSGAFIYKSAQPMSYATDASTTFQVNVAGTLSVSVTTPDNWASGDVDTFLRNTVNLSVATNDASGFTASMYSDTTTDLTNIYKQSVTLPTLASSTTRSAFPTNHWGYSLKNGPYNSQTYGETDAGNNSSNYYPLVATSASPITILQANAGTATGEQSIYFGAKANTSQAAGTYTGTVLISVVTGVVNNTSGDPGYNPITPVDPATNNDTTVDTPTYTPDTNYPTDTTRGRTVYYTTSSTTIDGGSGTTTTTEVTTGDVRSSYSDPAGVTTRTTSNINDSSLALGLATTASVAAASGIFFFILAKRREEDEDDEEENQ